MKFIPQLNIRSVYNFQESLIKIDDYISFAQNQNFEYLFYCENKTMFGVAEFFKKAKKANIKPIIGLSIELIDNKAITLIPKNRKGYESICFISSELNDYKSLSEEEIMLIIKEKLSFDLITITNIDLEKQNTYLLNTDLYDAEKLNIFFNSIRYFKDLEKEYYNGVYALKNNITIIESKKRYLKNEAYPDYDDIEGMFPNTKKILDEISTKVEFDLFDDEQKYMAKYQTPDNIPSFKYLKEKCINNLKYYFSNVKKTPLTKNYVDRLKTELSVIEKTGFSDYFLIVQDYVSFAKKNNIIVGPGRGSAAGSLVSFLLRITTIDPIEHGLLFERFLNPERISMPDIDIDFQDNRRDEVIEYIFEKYGKYKMATIVTYQTIAFKSAFRDSCRVYEIDMNIVNLITKAISEDYMSYEEIIDSHKIIKEYSEKNEMIPVFELTKKLMGCPRQTGTHAAGIVMSDKDLRRIVPIRHGLNGIYQTQYDMNYLEDIGLIKMDLLGLRNLTTLKEIIDLVKKTNKVNIKLSDIPTNDQQTFLNLQKGSTTGIFQLESKGMTKVIVEMKVSSINDIAIASSLYRPGPQEMIPQYMKNRFSSNTRYIDDNLIDILQPTSGVIVYQEQVMNILQKVGSFSLGKADIVRRAMGKKQLDYMMMVKDEFLINAVRNGYVKEKALEIWNWIEKFANYGFNKSHAIAYSYIGYWLAWFKVHYPEEFYSSLLNGVLGNSNKTSSYIKEVKHFGIEVIKPSIKLINTSYAIHNKQIYMPLTLIKGIGKDFLQNLKNAYDEHEDLFDDINNFFFYMKDKGLNDANFTLLAKAGAFDCFGYNKATMIANKSFIFSAMTTFDISQDLKDQTRIENLFQEPMNEEIESQYEKEVFGFYVNANPITKLKNNNSHFKPMDIDKLNSNMFSENILGQVASIRTIKDKNNEDMAFVSFIDETGVIDLTVFAKTYEKIKYDLVVNKNYVLEIKTQVYQNKLTGVLLSIKALV